MATTGLSRMSAQPHDVDNREEDELDPVNPSAEQAAAMRIVEASLVALHRHGHFVWAFGARGKVLQADVGPFAVRYVTLFARLARAPARYGVDVWLARRGKVFTAWWAPSPLRVTLFRRGSWTNAFVPGSHVTPPEGMAAR
jgi:hypothetical protein